MPSKFGSVFRTNARVNPLNPDAVEVVVLSKDSSGYVTTAPSTLKQNLKRYLDRYRILTSGIEILDGEIINLALNFSITVENGYSKTEVLSNCVLALQEYFDVNNWQMNQPINLSEIKNVIYEVSGVLTAFDLRFFNRVGTFDNRTYSNTAYNVDDNTDSDIIYCKPNAIFEVKYPLKDIRGIAK